MLRLLLMLLPLALTAFAAKPTDYSTNMVMLENGEVMQTTKLFVSGQKSRIEGFSAGPLGKIVTIARKDLGVTWTLYLDRKQYSETSLASARPGRTDLSNLDLTTLPRETLGRETVLGHPCTKLRVTIGKLPNGRPMVATVWISDSLELPLRLETMGITQENRNLSIGRQPSSLFEIPFGFTKSNSPGRPAGLHTQSEAAVRGGETGLSAKRGVELAVSLLSGKGSDSWKLNTNYPGGDYRSIDMRSDNPTACKAACEKDAHCKAWTFVKPDRPGGASYCWLKDTVPEETYDDCCISGLKSPTAITPPPGSRMEWNVNRVGDDYRDFIPVRASAELCAAACAKEARCKAWTWVKNDVEPPNGHCWLKNPAPEPAPDDCCVSGVKSTGSIEPSEKYHLEWNVNRNGDDYRDFIPVRASAELCAAACAKEARCKAWTWVKNDVEPPNGHCWLKNPAPEPAPDDCCVSGVK